MKTRLKNALRRPIIHTIILIVLSTIFCIALAVVGIYLNRVYYYCGTFATCSVLDNLSSLSNSLVRTILVDVTFVARLTAEFSVLFLAAQLLNRWGLIASNTKTK